MQTVGVRHSDNSSLSSLGRAAGPAAIKAVIVKTPYAFLLAAAFATVAAVPLARPAQADTTSTIILAAAAGAIIGSLFTDSNNQPYYVSNGRHVYVSQTSAAARNATANGRTTSNTAVNATNVPSRPVPEKRLACSIVALPALSPIAGA
jgi:hypothetical protein